MFSIPKKTSDGKYFVKPLEKTFVQLDAIRWVSHDDNAVTIGLDEHSTTKITDVDAKIIQAAKDNSELWFERKVADKTIEAAFTKVIATEHDMSETWKNIMNVTRAAGSKVYVNKQSVDASIITEGSICDVVLEFCGVTFGKKNYGPSWRLVQTRVRQPRKKAYDDYLFQGDSDHSDSD